MLRLPEKVAVAEKGLHVSLEKEVPPRTLSSLEVQSRGDHGLRAGCYYVRDGQKRNVYVGTYFPPPKRYIRDTCPRN